MCIRDRVKTELGREGPFPDNPGSDRHGDQERPLGYRWCLDRFDVTGGELPGEGGADQRHDDAGGGDPCGLEELERTDQLKRDDQQGESDRELGESRERPRELGHDPSPEPPGPVPGGPGNGGYLEDSSDV